MLAKKGFIFYSTVSVLSQLLCGFIKLRLIIKYARNYLIITTDNKMPNAYSQVVSYVYGILCFMI